MAVQYPAQRRLTHPALGCLAGFRSFVVERDRDDGVATPALAVAVALREGPLNQLLEMVRAEIGTAPVRLHRDLALVPNLCDGNGHQPLTRPPNTRAGTRISGGADAGT